jgi:hypothetical protein
MMMSAKNFSSFRHAPNSTLLEHKFKTPTSKNVNFKMLICYSHQQIYKQRIIHYLK